MTENSTEALVLTPPEPVAPVRTEQAAGLVPVDDSRPYGDDPAGHRVRVLAGGARRPLAGVRDPHRRQQTHTRYLEDRWGPA